MKKTLAIMMVLVLAMGMVFAEYAVDSTVSATFNLNAKPAAAKVMIGLTTDYADAALGTKLDAFTSNPANFLDEGKWGTELPAQKSPIVPLTLKTEANGKVTYTSEKTPLFLWVVTRNADCKVEIEASPLAYVGDEEPTVKKIPYTLSYGSYGTINMGAEVSEPSQKVEIGAQNTGITASGAYNFKCSLTMLTGAVEQAGLAQSGDYKATVSGIISVQ